MMRKLFSIVMLLCLGTAWSYSQTDDTGGSAFGVKSAVNAGKSYIIDNDNALWFVGPVVGARYLYMSAKNAGLMFEVNYNKLYHNKGDATYSYDFIHAPFLTRFSFPFKNNSISLNVGSYVQLILHHDASVVYDRTTLFGMTGGVEYAYAFGNVVLSLEGRYHSNLHSNSETVDDLRSSWFEVGLGLTFGKTW
jgi:hypothetical protein